MQSLCWTGKVTVLAGEMVRDFLGCKIPADEFEQLVASTSKNPHFEYQPPI